MRPRLRIISGLVLLLIFGALMTWWRLDREADYHGIGRDGTSQGAGNRERLNCEFADGMAAAQTLPVMPNKNHSTKRYDENFKSAAADFVKRNGHNVEQSAAELGVGAADLQQWTKEFDRPAKSPKSISAMGKLRAENETLRNQILQLQMQWDILRTTLGVLSTTVSRHEAM